MRNQSNHTTNMKLQRTEVIGRETPGLTYAIFCGIAEKNAEDQRRKEAVKSIKAKLFFWRKEERP